MTEPQQITVFIDNYRLKSEANMSSHWAVKSSRVGKDRETAQMYVKARLNERSNRRIPDLKIPVRVSLTRISPRKFDNDDNLPMALKAVRDGVADALLPHNRMNQHRTWADDDDGQILWEYDWRKGKPKQHAIEIVITEVEG